MSNFDLNAMATQQRLLAQALDRAGLAKLGTIAHDLADKIRQQALAFNQLSARQQDRMLDAWERDVPNDRS